MTDSSAPKPTEILRSLRLLRSADPHERRRGIEVLSHIRDDPRVHQVFEHLYQSDPDPRVRQAAWQALHQFGPSIPAPGPADGDNGAEAAAPAPPQPETAPQSPAPAPAPSAKAVAAARPSARPQSSGDTVPPAAAQDQPLPGGMFVFNPENRILIQQAIAQPKQDRSSVRVPLAIAGVLFALVIILGIQVWPALRDWHRLRTSGINVPGTITALDAEGGTYRATYNYETAHDTTPVAYIHTQRVTREEHERLAPGTAVTVTYWPDDPALAQIDADNPAHDQRNWTVAAAGMVALAALILLLQGLARLLSRRDSGPRVVPAQVLEAVGALDTDGDYKVRVKYRFKSPESQRTITGQSRQIRNDLRRQPLPKPGARVAVYYLGDDRYRLL